VHSTLTDRRALLSWFASARRDLPWRHTRDPWAVLVSELMLQQTQVSRVLPRYEAFLEGFPTPSACAQGSVADVVRAWHGLGYNRRAVSLYRAATVVVDGHDGQLPADLDALLALPGVGPYTARAVLAFAFERDVGVVDTNAGRVLARTSGRRLGPRRAQDLADGMVPRGRGWAWNQAMLDLGATVCTRRAPRCDSCPLSPGCAWRGGGFRAPDPAERSAGAGVAQSGFGGSDRQGRGRLVGALRRGPVPIADAARVAGWLEDPDRGRRVVASIVADGLAVEAEGFLALP
jgi:A/G-specific adenine glycosylase